MRRNAPTPDYSDDTASPFRSGSDNKKIAVMIKAELTHHRQTA
jgi:hypothetical protein